MIFAIDDTALMALRCLALLFVQTKVKRADDDIPYVMRFVPVSIDLMPNLCILYYY